MEQDTAREEIIAEAAYWLSAPGLEMVDDLAAIKGSPRTVFVGAARINGTEGIVHIVRKRNLYYAMFTSDAANRERWGN